MTKKETPEDKLEGIENALSRTEQYIEENRKSLSIIVLAVVLVVAIYFAFTSWYLKPQEEHAKSQMYIAQRYFERDSFKLALNGDNNFPGFLGIIEDFRLTKSADLAHYYAGICYKNLGQFEKAIEYLRKFDSKDRILSCEALGAIGDCYAELGKSDDACKYYLRAADKVKNDFTSPIYLLRAGILLEQGGNYKKALELYQRIEQEYQNTAEGQEIIKYITRAKVKGNL